MKNIILLSLIGIFIIAFSSCKKDDPVVPNEEELITTLKLTLTPTAGGSAVEYSFTDLDGDGGNAATLVEGTLEDSTSYTAQITLLNEQESPAEDITEEVEEEDEEHQLFYETDIADLNITYTDMDDNGNPVGLSTNVTTGNAGTGTLTVTLRHEPVKSATGVASGDITNAGGETDISVTFNVTIQ